MRIASRPADRADFLGTNVSCALLATRLSASGLRPVIDDVPRPIQRDALRIVPVQRMIARRQFNQRPHLPTLEMRLRLHRPRIGLVE